MGNTSSAETAQTISESSAVVSSISSNGQPTYVQDPAEPLGTYKSGSKELMQLNADEVATVEYWLYLEGCDEQCVNAVQSRTSELQLAFTGVDTEESGKGETS